MITKILKNIFLLLISIFLTFSNLKSETLIDSLENSLKKNDTKNKLEIFNLLSFYYFEDNPEKSIDYANNAIQLSIQQNNNIQQAKAYENLGLTYRGLLNNKLAIKNFEKAFEIYLRLKKYNKASESFDNYNQILKNYYNYDSVITSFKLKIEKYKNQNKRDLEAIWLALLANSYNLISERDKALDFYKKSQSIFESINDEQGTAIVNIYKGDTYSKMQDYEKSNQCYLEAESTLIRLNETEALYELYYLISRNYRSIGNLEKAVYYAEKSIHEIKKVNDLFRLAWRYTNITSIYSNMGYYPQAFDYLHKSLKIYENIGIKRMAANTLNLFGLYYKDLEGYQEALEYHKKALKLLEEINSPLITALSYYFIGTIYLKLNDYEQAQKSLETSLTLFKELKDNRGIAVCLNSIAEINEMLGNSTEALKIYDEVLKLKSIIGIGISTPYGLIPTESNLGRLYFKLGDYIQSVKYLDISINEATKSNLKIILKDDYTILYQIKRNLNKNDKALYYLELYTNLKDSIFSEQSRKQISRMEIQYITEKKDKENKILQQKNEIQNLEISRQKSIVILLIIITALVVIVILFILNRYIKNKRINKILTEKNNQIELANIELSDLNSKVTSQNYELVKLNEQLEKTNVLISKEQEKSEKLLLNILPEPIATRLKNGETTIADHYDEISVVFIDIVKFTEFSKTRSPEEVVQLLNAIYTEFDKIADKYGLEKIKTIGDCYMAVAGIPNPREDHSIMALSFAIEAMNIDTRIIGYGNFTGIDKINFRCGIDTGEVVAGVIGEKKFIFDIWGDVVNTASRMEGYSEPNEIQITKRMKDSLEYQNYLGKINVEIRSNGLKDIKGKGMMETFTININS